MKQRGLFRGHATSGLLVPLSEFGNKGAGTHPDNHYHQVRETSNLLLPLEKFCCFKFPTKQETTHWGFRPVKKTAI